MKITSTKNDLNKAISNVSRAVATKASVPSLEGVLLKAEKDQIKITGYDLEMGIRTEIVASVQEEGAIVVPAKLFGDIIKKLPDEMVTIETDERNVVTIISGESDFQIMGLSAADYSDLPQFEETDKFVINGGQLKDMVQETIYATSTNYNKPIYTGSLFEVKNGNLTIAAIDGYRMAITKKSINSNSENSFVIPRKMQSEVLKLITDNEVDIELLIGQRHVSFKVDNYYVISRLLEGQFIDYNSTIPSGTSTVIKINRKDFINSVDRTLIIGNDKIPSPVRLTVKGNTLKLKCQGSGGKVKDKLEVETSGEDVEIGFNNQYLLDALKARKEEEVKLIINGSLSPMVMKPIEGDEFTSLVVPMRLQ